MYNLAVAAAGVFWIFILPSEEEEFELSKGSGAVPASRRPGILFPISARFIIFFASILAISLLVINGLLSSLATGDLYRISREYAMAVNSRSAAEAENLIYSARSDSFVLLNYIGLTGRDSPLGRQATAVFFEHNYTIAAVIVPGAIELINNQFFIANEASPGSVVPWLAGEALSVQQARQGIPVITNPSMELGTSLLAMFYPWQWNGFEEVAVIIFSPDALAEAFGTGSCLSFLADAGGNVLVHPDFRMAGESVNISAHPLFDALSSGSSRSQSLDYSIDGEKYIGAGKKISIGGLMVISSMEQAPIAGRSLRGANRIIFLIIAVICISILAIWIFVNAISVPLRKLGEAMAHVANGDFSIKADYRFPDEIGALTGKFNDMAASLERRERFLSEYKQSAQDGGNGFSERTGTGQ